LRAVRLPVAGAFHSPAMQPAVAGFREALALVRFREPEIPILSCASAREFDSPRAELADALVRPVRWRETMRALRERRIERFVETGPGDVLTKLVERNAQTPEVSVA
jgi:malonyl CoA-acyl carrier protein transacylase